MLFQRRGRKIASVMKMLYLLRHAKSSWDDPHLADLDRPLNNRGLSAAPFMGSLIAWEGYQPSIILSSPAKRAEQTAQAVRLEARLHADLRFDDRIYEASPQGLRQVVSELDDSMDSALLVGHNPGIEGFIRYLSGAIEPIPTAALAVLELRIGSWSEINDGCGVIKKVYLPKVEAAKRQPSE